MGEEEVIGSMICKMLKRNKIEMKDAFWMHWTLGGMDMSESTRPHPRVEWVPKKGKMMD